MSCSIRRLALVVVLASAWTRASAQDSSKDNPLLPRVGETMSADEMHQAMLDAIRELDRSMHEFDRALWQKSVDAKPDEENAVLGDARKRMASEVEQLDRILALANHSHPGGGS